MSDETEEQKKLMRQIDISCVQAFHTMDEIDAMVELAKKYRLAAVFTLPAFSAHVAERLQDTREIHAGGVVSFPGGGDTTGQKKRQAKELWEAGCREIDMVMNLTAFRSHEFSYVKEELLAIREQVPSAIFKVIIRGTAADGAGNLPGSGSVCGRPCGLCKDEHRMVSRLSFHRGAGSNHEP